MKPPNWTVWAQKQEGKYIATCCHFYEAADEASFKYKELCEAGWIAVLRPWSRTEDLHRMGVLDRQEIQEANSRNWSDEARAKLMRDKSFSE